MKKFTLTMIFAALTVVVFGQTVQTAKTALEAGVVNVYQNQITTPKGIVLSEGFETMVIPGTMNGWTLVQNNPSKTWEITVAEFHGGAQALSCEYDPALVLQDERMVTPVLDFSTATAVTVDFWWQGSKYWGAFPYDNYDLLLKYSVDGGTTWATEVWTEMTDDTALWTSWTWKQATVNVPAVVGQSNVKFAFIYYGTDGAQWVIDDISVDGAGMAGVTPVELTPVQISIFPNPASDNMNIESNFGINNVRIFNDFGQLVLEQVLDGKSATLNISNLTEGLYFVEVTGENGKYTRKITVR
ncbi:MAG TPA: T9SS type A sorting domain-containing protein [Bacteroidales bacterium]|nr:T9SS type A sorting domain-containing protein [Bacteroidales bacterium]